MAYASIARSLAGMGHAPPAATLSAELARPAASFVTLTLDGRLRGCCGTLEARQALALDVWANASASAFRDSRFAPLERHEYSLVEAEISVLSPLEALSIRSERDLLESLRPGRDGLLLVRGAERATFLPQVWDELPDATEFVTHLKRKAGWLPSFWADDIRVFRYEAEHFAEPDVQHPELSPHVVLGGSNRRK
jgi:uncharacterized protein